jgi:hypothetical protein
MTLNVAEICVLWDGGECDNVNIFSFKFRQQSDGCATNTESRILIDVNM